MNACVKAILWISYSVSVGTEIFLAVFRPIERKSTIHFENFPRILSGGRVRVRVRFRVSILKSSVFQPSCRSWAEVITRGRTLRIPARHGYPSYFGARGLPYPLGNAISTTGYPGTRFLAGHSGTRHLCKNFFLPTSLPRRMKLEWKVINA